jgi:hypothetical protein
MMEMRRKGAKHAKKARRKNDGKLGVITDPSFLILRVAFASFALSRRI